MLLHDVFKKEMCVEKGQLFLTDFILTENPWSYPLDWTKRKVLYTAIPEFPFSEASLKKDSKGRSRAVVRFVDIVYFVGNGLSAAYNGEAITIGVEIKTNLFDLLRDEKMGCYLYKTNYTFLAVPDGLIPDALKKVNGFQGMGVFSLSSGKIIKKAKRHEVDHLLYEQAVLRALLSPGSINKYTFTIQNTPSVVPVSENNRECISISKETNTITLKTKKIMNFVGNRKPEVRTPRFELKNGKITRWMGVDQPAEEYDYCEGCLIGIDLRRRETRNGEIVYCDFHFRNGEELFDISTIASSGVTADLVSRLKNVREPAKSTIRIDAWQNNRFTNVVLKENGQPVMRAVLPRVQKIDRGFKVELDSSSRDAAVMAIIEEINAKIQDKA